MLGTTEPIFRWDAWEALAREGRIADAVVEYVRCYDYVTFAELDRRLSPFIDTNGTFALTVEGCPNTIFYAGLSEELCDVYRELLGAQRVFLAPASELTYLIDGGSLRLPIPRRLPKNGGDYATEHWLPVTLRIIPLADEKPSLTRRKTRRNVTTGLPPTRAAPAG